MGHDLHVYELVDTQTAGEYAFFKIYNQIVRQYETSFRCRFPSRYQNQLKMQLLHPQDFEIHLLLQHLELYLHYSQYVRRLLSPNESTATTIPLISKTKLIN